jgi:hypothetical protein
MKGTVEEVVGSVDAQSAEALVVRRAWRRRKVPVAAIDAVVPASRLIVVDDHSEEAVPAVARARTFAHASARAASWIAAKVARNAPPLARVFVRVVRAIVLLIAAGVVALARVLFVVVVRSVSLALAVGMRLAAEIRARRASAVANQRR